jgi:hypothetical protein
MDSLTGPQEKFEEPIKGNYLNSFSNLIITLFKYIFLSIIIVHFFGIFGVFIAFAYPLLWFFFPQKTPCFYCLHKSLSRKKEHCHVCNREIVSIFDPGFRSMVINTITLFIISILLFLLIILEINLLFGQNVSLLNFLQNRAGSGSIVLQNSDQYIKGGKYYFDVDLNEMNAPINLASIEISYNEEIIEVTSIDTSRSFATIFSKKEYSNTSGNIYVVGGVPGSGNLSNNTNFFRIYFLAKNVGETDLTFTSAAKVYAADGHGTDLSYKFNSQRINIY